MWKHVRGGLLLLALGGVASISLPATHLSAGIFSNPCRNCQRPVSNCNCNAQHTVFNAQQPVVETQLVPQQVTTYRNEVVTQYRQEAVTQAVPVTTYRDVVVDEGSYQTVYVPRQVTKRVPQVSYQQQVAYRSVPYQVTRQVPQVVTQMVPQQVARYQPYSYQSSHVVPLVSVAQTTPTYATPTQTGCGCATAMPVIAAAPCHPCGTTAYVPSSAYSSVPAVIGQTYHPLSTIAAPISNNPVTMLPPTSTTLSSHAPESDRHSNPVPDPKFLDSPGAVKESWTTVGSRSGGRSGVDPVEASRTASRGSGLFKPARTVYRSWETQSRVAASDTPARQ